MSFEFGLEHSHHQLLVTCDWCCATAGRHAFKPHHVHVEIHVELLNVLYIKKVKVLHQCQHGWQEINLV